MASRGNARQGYTTTKANRLGGGFVRLGKAGRGVARPGEAGHGITTQDKVHHRLLDTAGDGFIGLGRAWLGETGLGMVRLG